MTAIHAFQSSAHGDRAVPHDPAAASDAAIVGAHAAPLLRYARALGAPRDLALDLAQEALLVAWKKRKQHLPAPALAAFLRRTVRFLWLDQCRNARRAEAAIAAAAERLWQQDCADDGGERWLEATRACVQQLTGRAAAAVRLAYGEDWSRDQIADELRMRPNGVRTLLARTRKWLATCIGARLQ